MSPERKAVIVAASTAVFLTILKFVTGIFTGSMAIITSAADSALDFVVSLMNYFAVRTSEREADETHNYGHGKVE
jgi:divalent metal cation (Fe/Co/Zn/Cd) transporter